MTKKNFLVKGAGGIISVYPISFDNEKIRLYRETKIEEALKNENLRDEIFYSSDIFGKPDAARVNLSNLLLRNSDRIAFADLENSFGPNRVANYNLAYYLEERKNQAGIYRNSPLCYLLPYYDNELSNRPFRVPYPTPKYFIPLVKKYDITHCLAPVLQVSRLEYFLYALSIDYMKALSDITPKEAQELSKLDLFTIDSTPQQSFNPSILKNYREQLNSLRDFLGMEAITEDIEELSKKAELDTPVYQMCIKNK